jgi:hypothetical protein
VLAGDGTAASITTAVTSGSSTPLTLSVTGAPPGVDVRLSQQRIPAGGHATLTVTTSTSTRPGSYPLTVEGRSTTGATHAAKYTLIVAGSGSLPLVADESSLTFDGQSVGTPSKPQDVKLTNTGKQLVNISGIDVSGDFGQTSSCGAAIAPGSSCVVSVTLSATAAGRRTGELSISDDANPVRVTLRGTAAGSSNLALNKPASASGTQDGYPPENMTDGNTGSYWESTNNAFPQSATVDLGAPATITKLVLTLPPPSAWSTRTQTLAVLGSLDGKTFTQLLASADYTFDPATGNTVTVKLPPSTVRFVKLEVTANTGWPAAQFSEVEVHAP